MEECPTISSILASIKLQSVKIAELVGLRKIYKLLYCVWLQKEKYRQIVR